MTVEFQNVTFDTRGRNYTESNSLPQGGETGKASVRTPFTCTITKGNVHHVVNTLNDLADRDSDLTEDETRAIAIMWEAVRSQVIGSYEYQAEVRTFVEYALDIGIEHATAVAQYAIDLVKFWDTGTCQTALPVYFDAKTSAIQHQAYLTGSATFAELGALIGAGTSDLYATCWDALERLAKNSEEWDGSTFRADITPAEGRAIAKRSAMIAGYGATAGTQAKHVKEKAASTEGVPEAQAALYSALWKDAMATVAGDGVYTLQAFAKDLTDHIKNNTDQQYIAFRVVPDGVDVVRWRVSQSNEIEISEDEDGEMIYNPEAKAAWRSMQSAVVPDVVHALDGEHMRRMIVSLRAQGVETVYHVHDSIGVPLDDAELVFPTFRDTFYSMQRDAGGDVFEFIASQYPGFDFAGKSTARIGEWANHPDRESLMNPKAMA